MNSRLLRILHRLPRPLNILLITPSQATNHRDMIGFHISDLIGDQSDGFKVGIGRRRKSGLYNVDAEARELPRDIELLLGGHGGSGGLLTVAKSGIKDADILGVRNVIGDVLRAAEGAADGGGSWTAISEEAQCADG